MKLSQLVKIMCGGDISNYTALRQIASRLPRYAAMAGIELNTSVHQAINTNATDEQNPDIPMEAVREILSLDFAERQTANLKAMGEGIGRMSVNLPSNVNVWQHVKGETQLTQAALALTEAAKAIGKAAVS